MFHGTDINAAALKKADAGVYELDRIALFTRNHRRSGGKSSLSDYYTAAYGAAVFDKTLRSRPFVRTTALPRTRCSPRRISFRAVTCSSTSVGNCRIAPSGSLRTRWCRRDFFGIGAKESLHFSRYAVVFPEFVGEERIYQKRGEQ